MGFMLFLLVGGIVVWRYYAVRETTDDAQIDGDILTVRIQAIDGARTFTPQDSQPCRLLPSVYASTAASRQPPQKSRSGSFAAPLL